MSLWGQLNIFKIMNQQNAQNPYDPSAEEEIFSEQQAMRPLPNIRSAWTKEEMVAVAKYTNSGAALVSMKHMRDQGMPALEVMSALRRRQRETALWSAVRFQGQADMAMTSVKTKMVDTPLDSGIDVVVITVTYDNRTTETTMGEPRAKRMKQ